MRNLALVLLVCCLVIGLSGCGGGDDSSPYSLGGHYGGWISVTEVHGDYNHIFSLWGELEQNGAHVSGVLECPLDLDFEFDFDIVGNEVVGTIKSFLGVMSFIGTTDGVKTSGVITETIAALSPEVYAVYDGNFEITKSL